MVNALEAFGIRVEAAHHEVAAGQHEIDFEYADGLKTADNAITFKFTLKAIANLHGLYAPVMPSPSTASTGRRAHPPASTRGRSRNSFADATSVRPHGPGAQLHGRHPGPRPGMMTVLAPR